MVGLLLGCQQAAPTPPQTPAPMSSALPTPSAPPAAVASSAPPAAALPPAYPSPSMRKFSEDVEFLNQHGAAIKVLESVTGGRIAVSGKYQARVMTSSVDPEGSSLGFVNRSFIEAGKTATAFDNYAAKIASGSAPKAASTRCISPPARRSSSAIGRRRTPFKRASGSKRRPRRAA